MENLTTGSSTPIQLVNGTYTLIVAGDLATSVTPEISDTEAFTINAPLVSEVDTPATLTVPQVVELRIPHGWFRLTMVGTGDCDWSLNKVNNR